LVISAQGTFRREVRLLPWITRAGVIREAARGPTDAAGAQTFFFPASHRRRASVAPAGAMRRLKTRSQMYFHP
jgi:hypothetical protein